MGLTKQLLEQEIHRGDVDARYDFEYQEYVSLMTQQFLNNMFEAHSEAMGRTIKH